MSDPSSMAVFDDARRFKARPRQVFCDLGEETVILDLQESLYYGLNPVAARIWELLQNPISVLEIQTRILEEYDVPPQDCRRDLDQLLGILLEKGLIEGEHESVG